MEKIKTHSIDSKVECASKHMQGYPASKALAEKAAWKFAEENHIDLITVIPTLTTGPSVTTDIPSSVGMAASLITGSKLSNLLV